jgi:5-methylcytosine-specific restriction endonuclease McrA
MKLSALQTLAEIQAQPHDLQKRASKLEDREAARKENSRKEVAFRKAVIARDGGKCRLCGIVVKRTLELVPNRAEVHHLRGRNVAPADRYNVSAALLLCRRCHDQAQRHLVTLPEKPDAPI